jgi:hypothetical protein
MFSVCRGILCSVRNEEMALHRKWECDGEDVRCVQSSPQTLRPASPRSLLSRQSNDFGHHSASCNPETRH